MIMPKLSGGGLADLTTTHIVFACCVVFVSGFFVAARCAGMTWDHEIPVCPTITAMIFGRVAWFAWFAVGLLVCLHFFQSL